MFQTFFTNPLINVLVFFYNTAAFQDFGLAIIFLTLFIRIILFPLFYKSTKNQILIQRLQPELNKIQHDHKDNKEKQAQAMMDLYKKHNVNPFAGFLMIFLQLPVLIAIYNVFLQGFTPEIFQHLYGFIAKPEVLNTTLLGLLDLKKGSILMVSLAAAAQYLQGYFMMPRAEKGKELSSAEQINRQMMYIGPVLTVVILGKLPAAIGLYWLITSIFSVAQQVYINKTLNIKEEKKEHGITQAKN